MTSTRERQRAAARARLEREMALRAEAARRRRQRQAIIGAGVAVVLVVAGTVWLVLGGGDDKKTTAADASTGPVTCTWNAVPTEGRPATLKDVGTPPTSVPRSGKEVMAIETNFGTVNVTMDRAKAPCATASYAYLASKNFFDGTKCHRMLPGVLQCGDPSAKGKGYRETDGTGGPTYQFAAENLPVNEKPTYPSGVVAMANSGPDTNGSQFFFVVQDTEFQADYTVIGKTDAAGIEVIKKAIAKGDDGAFEPQPGGGHPKSDIEIKTMTVKAAAG